MKGSNSPCEVESNLTGHPIIKPGMDSKAGVARFEAERPALASENAVRIR